MSLKERLQNEIKQAMREKAKETLGVLRMISAEIKQKEIDEQITLDDQQIIAVLTKMRKQRQDSFEQYTAAGRDDLAKQEQFELTLLQAYLPTPLSEQEIDELIETAISTLKAASIKDMGQVMNQLRPTLVGRADLKQVSQQVKQRLSTG